LAKKERKLTTTMPTKIHKTIPDLRFPEFEGEWEPRRIGDLFDRRSDPVDVEPEVQYRQIGIRSHGKGIFHKPPVSGKSLGNKRVFWIKEDALVLNIVFAWEQAVAKTTSRESGMIASHRFPMFESKEQLADLDYFLRFFLTKRGKFLLELASPGGAGRNKTLGQKEFEKLTVLRPDVGEQKKIAAFLSAVDRRIEGLEKKRELLKEYKKGLMQKLFSQTLRFVDDNGNPFPDWEKKRLGEVASFSKGKGVSKDDISEGGETECIRYGELYTHYNELISDVRSKTNVDVSELVLSEENDVIIPASGETQIDIATASCIQRKGIAIGGDLNIIRTPNNGVFLAYYLNNKLKHDIAKLAQGVSVIHLYPTHLKTLKLSLPHPDEQNKIAQCLVSLEAKIEQVGVLRDQTKDFKKGLLQQMFV